MKEVKTKLPITPLMKMGIGIEICSNNFLRFGKVKKLKLCMNQWEDDKKLSLWRRNILPPPFSVRWFVCDSQAS